VHSSSGGASARASGGGALPSRTSSSSALSTHAGSSGAPPPPAALPEPAYTPDGPPACCLSPDAVELGEQLRAAHTRIADALTVAATSLLTWRTNAAFAASEPLPLGVPSTEPERAAAAGAAMRAALGIGELDAAATASAAAAAGAVMGEGRLTPLRDCGALLAFASAFDPDAYELSGPSGVAVARDVHALASWLCDLSASPTLLPAGLLLADLQATRTGAIMACKPTLTALRQLIPSVVLARAEPLAPMLRILAERLEARASGGPPPAPNESLELPPADAAHVAEAEALLALQAALLGGGAAAASASAAMQIDASSAAGAAPAMEPIFIKDAAVSKQLRSAAALVSGLSERIAAAQAALKRLALSQGRELEVDPSKSMFRSLSQ
jgi:hypothetical protein